MKDLMIKVYDEKMKNGDFEKIVGDKIDEAIKKTFDEMFGWNGTVKKELEAKLKEVMSSVIEKSDFGNYVEKIKLVIDESVKGSNLESYHKILEQVANLVGKPKYDINTTRKVSELFDKYCDFATKEIEANDYSDYDIEEEVVEGQVSGEFSFSFEVQTSENYFGDKDLTIVFKTINDANYEVIEDLTIAFKLWKIGKDMKIHYSLETNENILNLNDFELEIISLKNASAKIEVDKEEDLNSDIIYWDYEY